MYRFYFLFIKIAFLLSGVVACWTSGLRAADADQIIELSKWSVSSTDDMGGTIRKGSVRVGKSELSAVIKTTSKGNGVLLLKNLQLRVWDVHRDGAVYSDGWLNIEALGNPKPTVLIYGVIMLYDDNDKAGANPTYHALFGVYEYNSRTDAFTKKYGNAYWGYAEMTE